MPRLVEIGIDPLELFFCNRFEMGFIDPLATVLGDQKRFKNPVVKAICLMLLQDEGYILDSAQGIESLKKNYAYTEGAGAIIELLQKQGLDDEMVVDIYWQLGPVKLGVLAEWLKNNAALPQAEALDLVKSFAELTEDQVIDQFSSKHARSSDYPNSDIGTDDEDLEESYGEGNLQGVMIELDYEEMEGKAGLYRLIASSPLTLAQLKKLELQAGAVLYANMEGYRTKNSFRGKTIDA